MKKHLLAGALALSTMVGCNAATQANMPVEIKYDNDTSKQLDVDKAQIENDSKIILTLCWYNVEGKLVDEASLGTGLPVRNTTDATYLMTAQHVVECDQDSKGMDVYMVEGRHLQQLFDNRYVLPDFIKEEPKYFTGLEVLVSEEDNDSAILEAPPFDNGLGVNYKVGDSDQIDTGDAVMIVGHPLAISHNTNYGRISSIRGPVTMDNPYDAFMLDPRISGGNSGGPVLTSQDGTFNVVGFVSHGYMRGDGMFVAYKVNPVMRMLDKALAKKGE